MDADWVQRARATSVSSLAASWAVLSESASGQCWRTDAVVAARTRYPVLNNALLLLSDRRAVDQIEDIYRDEDRWALWTGEPSTDRVAEAAGLRRDVSTTDMLRPLVDLPPRAEGVAPDRGEPGLVAELNGVSRNVAPHHEAFTALVARGGAGGLLLFRHDDDVQLSFLAVKETSRGLGVGSALVVAALHEAHRQGATTVTLQATPNAVGLYRKAGFHVVGRWQEWTPPGAVDR